MSNVSSRISRKIKSASSRNGRFRLAVFRSNTNIYAQIIDDVNGVTLVSASSLKSADRSTLKDKAVVVGTTLAERAIAKNINSVWFDRAGYKFTGRVKALADAVRAAGLEF